MARGELLLDISPLHGAFSGSDHTVERGHDRTDLGSFVVEFFAAVVGMSTSKPSEQLTTHRPCTVLRDRRDASATVFNIMGGMRTRLRGGESQASRPLPGDFLLLGHGLGRPGSNPSAGHHRVSNRRK